MIFHRVDPNSEYRALRLLSEGGRWELGMSPYSHGMRMRMGLAGRPPKVMDFCMGRDPELWPKVLVAVLGRLEGVGETVGVEEVDAVFPWAGKRPDLTMHLALLLDGLTGESNIPACIDAGPQAVRRSASDSHRLTLQ